MHYDLPGGLTFVINAPFAPPCWEPESSSIRTIKRKDIRERKRWKKIHRRQGRH